MQTNSPASISALTSLTATNGPEGVSNTFVSPVISSGLFILRSPAQYVTRVLPPLLRFGETAARRRAAGGPALVPDPLSTTRRRGREPRRRDHRAAARRLSGVSRARQPRAPRALPWALPSSAECDPTAEALPRRCS